MGALDGVCLAIRRSRRHRAAAYRGHLGLQRRLLSASESSLQTRQEWITALDTIDSLRPRAVVVGYKRPGSDDGPRDVEETRQYIRVFGAVLTQAQTHRQVYDMMISRYPARLYPDALWASARELVK